VKIRYWGTRGSLATPGSDTVRYGGNTSCVEVRGEAGEVLVLDAGTGIRPLGEEIDRSTERVDVLLTHLHMDHIQGLGFFDPLFWPELDVHIWGPSSMLLPLRARLSRYLSPPLFPVRLRDLPCKPSLHDAVEQRSFQIGGLSIEARLVCHPGPTVGYRIREGDSVLCYLPDHEPELGVDGLPDDPRWIPGFELAEGADLLIHDAQFTSEEYPSYVGWGHSSIEQALSFAAATGVSRLAPFHHDPMHTDSMLDGLYAELARSRELGFELVPAREGECIVLGGNAVA
jgi:phosphoribosyl 1,2-cyclic phosphodiesterase